MVADTINPDVLGQRVLAGAVLQTRVARYSPHLMSESPVVLVEPPFFAVSDRPPVSGRDQRQAPPASGLVGSVWLCGETTGALNVDTRNSSQIGRPATVCKQLGGIPGYYEQEV